MIIALVVPYWLDQVPEQLRRAEACARTLVARWTTTPRAMRRWVTFVSTTRLNPNEVYIAVDRANWLVRVDKPAEALQGPEPHRERGRARL
jgi:hypothetical protein